jgi:thiamine pyrophosphate-dependent acetolactate synthase large subunit-like protein
MGTLAPVLVRMVEGKDSPVWATTSVAHRIEQLWNVVHLACRTALAYKGVAHINFPVDLQEQAGDERSPRNVPGHNADVYARSARLPDEADRRRAAEILAAGRKVAILAGQGAARHGRAGAARRAAGGAHRQGAAREGCRSRR